MRAVAVTVPSTLPVSHGGVNERLIGTSIAEPAYTAPSRIAFELGSWIRYERAATFGSPGIFFALPTAVSVRLTTRVAYSSSRHRLAASPLAVLSGQSRSDGCVRPSVPTTVTALPPNR